VGINASSRALVSAGSASAIVLHSVPPLVVFVAVEAITDLRDKLTEAVTAAHAHAVTAGHDRDRRSARPDGLPTSRRKLFGEYLAEARAAWSPGMPITPAWARQVTGCSRGLSSRLARVLAAELGQGGGGHERS
jgi:hypothetical protein